MQENEDFMNQIKRFRKNRVLQEGIRELIKNEEETKLKLVNPFLKILGYDVEEVGVLVSEGIADFRNKKGKKVDYIAYKENKPIMLIEAKYHKKDLQHSTEQLEFYFDTKVKDGCHLAMLTNGIEYRFFSDLDNINKIDEEPFFIFDFRDFKEKDLEILQKFTYNQIDVAQIQELGKRLKNYGQVLEILTQEMENPSTDLVRFFATKVSKAQRTTASIIEEFSKYLKEAFNEVSHSKHKTLPTENVISQKTPTVPTQPKITHSYTEDDHLKNIPENTIRLYEIIKKEILKLEGISLEPKKQSISFIVGKKSIVSFVILQGKIKVYFNLKYSEINDYKNRIRDVSKIATWGVGDCEFIYENIEDIVYMIPFIKQSYNKNR
ncbi:hypothetical protein BKH42_05160 [Helicobacter sp. 13S00482-2]|uniref:type I restriction endonuclease n=1 Tax=Helicobacter sp. 13S00482-2 TaxID=1476200 RepID=UPI000BA7CCDD|nr:type I restriction endonuclease [Helicobacter sp. 13S00482-2]PAF53572.1 hypothetical protein BKH42_05160 [Helicobacter sp. 13S00482-2]